VGEILHGDSEGPSQTEVSQLEDSLSVDENVLGFEVSVEHFVLVTFACAVEQLVEEGLDVSVGHAIKTRGVNQTFEVLVQELEDEGQIFIGVDHIDEPDDVWVLEFLEERDLSDGCAGDALVCALESDLLHGVDVAFSIAGLVDDSVGAFANHLELFVVTCL
jgi:hypothetical protein